MQPNPDHRKLSTLTLLCIAAFVLVLVFWPANASGPYYGTINEARAWGMVSGSRATRNINSASWSSTLARCAHTHAREMMEADNTFHGTPCNTTITQIVGQGPSPLAVYRGFLGSPSHRSAIYDSQLRRLGTGVASRDGTYYVVMDFAR